MPQARDELAELFPGKTIEIKGNGRTIRVTVYPMAIKHFRTFKDSVTKAMDKIGKAPWRRLVERHHAHDRPDCSR